MQSYFGGGLARYIKVFRAKGFKSVVVVHFGDEVAFDDDDNGNGKCRGRLYNELRVPIVRNYWSESCAQNPYVHIVPLGQGACTPECRANLPSYDPWHYFGNISYVFCLCFALNLWNSLVPKLHRMAGQRHAGASPRRPHVTAV